MTKPEPKAIEPARLVELALAVVAADRFPQLATIDGDQPRLRPVSPVRSDGFTIYVANLRQYHKTVEIAANHPQAEHIEKDMIDSVDIVHEPIGQQLPRHQIGETRVQGPQSEVTVHQFQLPMLRCPNQAVCDQ